MGYPACLTRLPEEELLKTNTRVVARYRGVERRTMPLTRLIASQLLGVSVTNPLTFVVVSCLLCAVALAASYLTARRATRVEPLIALRAD